MKDSVIFPESDFHMKLCNIKNYNYAYYTYNEFIILYRYCQDVIDLGLIKFHNNNTIHNNKLHINNEFTNKGIELLEYLNYGLAMYCDDKIEISINDTIRFYENSPLFIKVKYEYIQKAVAFLPELVTIKDKLKKELVLYKLQGD